MNDLKIDKIFEKERLCKSSFDGFDYYYYVSFLRNMDYELRKAFIKEIKDNPISKLDRDAYLLLHSSILEFKDKVGFDKYDMIIYPDTSHNQLVNYLANFIKSFLITHKAKTKMLEIQKTKPSTIIMDESAKEKKTDEEINAFLDGIHKLDYFSIAKNGGSFRKYVRDFLDVENCDLMIKIKEATSNTKILLFDDINTTGSTLREMIRKLHKYNNSLHFDIYTIIGKENND